MSGLEPVVLVGGSGWIGSALATQLLAEGRPVTIVDRNPPPQSVPSSAEWQPLDLLVDSVSLPQGRVVVLTGTGEPRPAWPWTLPLDNAVTAARLAPALAGREVTLVSSVEVYGSAGGPLIETTVPCLPVSSHVLDDWCARLSALVTEGPCPPWRSARLCRELTESDPSGRWVYGLSKYAQERIVAKARPEKLAIFRVANVFGPGQDRVIAKFARLARRGRPIEVKPDGMRSFLPLEDLIRALTHQFPAGLFNLGGTTLQLGDFADELCRRLGSSSPVVRFASNENESCGIVHSPAFEATGGRFTPFDEALATFLVALETNSDPLFEPPLPVIVPARPALPDLVAERLAGALWSGRLKAGQLHTTDLKRELTAVLGLEHDSNRQVAVTTSGTAALRLAVLAAAGPASPAKFAVLPSYTFPATAEVLVRLGYKLRFADVDFRSWTLDPSSVDEALKPGDVAVVIGVDTFGNPLDYRRLRAVCDRHEVAFVADSAAALGSYVGGRPVASQADAHAFSMSFAKTVAAGGMGGFAVLPGHARFEPNDGGDSSEYMSELHAICGRDQVAELERLVAHRDAVAAVYEDGLAGIPDLITQRLTSECTSARAHFVVRIIGRDRESVAHSLAADGIGTKPYFRALHRTDFLGAECGKLVATDMLHAEALALPMSSEMTVRQAERVVVGVERAMGRLPQADRGRASVDPQTLGVPVMAQG
jgi:dTDP-4-amino-4,6-dideoxygalactose transaminase/nucleoside-diphosphate-sugar epimerase